MLLTNEGTRHPREWCEKGYALPSYDREQMVASTAKKTAWLHFGAGNIFRAFLGQLADDLLNRGDMYNGIVAAEAYDPELISAVYTPYDNLSVLVTLHPDGVIKKRVLGSIAGAVNAVDPQGAGMAQLKDIFTKPDLQMVTFTITEKGYAYTAPGSIIYKVMQLLFARYQAGGYPLALVSMDNCSHNGEKLYHAICTAATAFVSAGGADGSFMHYITTSVSFPWTMIDKITPRPDEAVKRLLEADGVEGMTPVVTSHDSYIAPYVNAEAPQYLIVEDHFPNGRPPLEKVGVYFTDRETVNKAERMKVCTCLNPLHTTLAIFGCLMDYHKISDEMDDADLVALVNRLGYTEGLPVVVDPIIFKPADFLAEVLEKRLPNPYIPDTPQRIATDMSQQLAIRFGQTVKTYLADPARNPADLKVILMTFAGWLRYLMGVDDAGHVFALSPDPMLAELQAPFADLHIGDTAIPARIDALLSREDIFGVDLAQAGLADAVRDNLLCLVAKPGAVRENLHRLVENFKEAMIKDNAR